MSRTLYWHVVLDGGRFAVAFRLEDWEGGTLAYGTHVLPDGLDHTEALALAAIKMFALAAADAIPNVERS